MPTEPATSPWMPRTPPERAEFEETLRLLGMPEVQYWRLIEQANTAAVTRFGTAMRFERSIFFSWYCAIRDCAFCYMSTQPKEKTRMARRSFESIYTEALLCKELGWQFGFLSGGIGVYTAAELKTLVANVSAIVGQPIWLNLGVLPTSLIQDLVPHIRGMVGSVETVDAQLHPKVCPSKPLAPIEHMYDACQKLGLENAMTIIIGLGEKPTMIDDLKAFIAKHRIRKIHLYGLNPQKGTAYENQKPPSRYLQAWYVASLRVAFPDIEIEAGVWEDRIPYIPLLLRSGATSLSKFAATRLFGKPQGIAFEEAVRASGRTFSGTLTSMPDIDWDAAVEKLNVDSDVKAMLRAKLPDYVDVMAGKKKLVRRAGKGQRSVRKVAIIAEKQGQ